MLESYVEDYFVKRVAQLGGHQRKLMYPGRRGAADRLVLLPGWHCVVELKRPGEKPRINQDREHVKARWAGFKVFVLSTIAEVDCWAMEVEETLRLVENDG